MSEPLSCRNCRSLAPKQVMPMLPSPPEGEGLGERGKRNASGGTNPIPTLTLPLKGRGHSAHTPAHQPATTQPLPINQKLFGSRLFKEREH
jgi:hypothetical protein